MSYRKDGLKKVIRLSDLAGILFIDGQTDYEEYKLWLAAGNTPLAENEAETVEQIRQRMWEQIKAERDRRKLGGTFVDPYWFHSDADSRIQQMGLVMMGANMPAGMMWKTMSGTFVEMTPTLAQQIFNATAIGDKVLFAKAEEHRAAMEASADPASYDYLSGWPAVYGA